MQVIYLNYSIFKFILALILAIIIIKKIDKINIYFSADFFTVFIDIITFFIIIKIDNFT